MSEIGLAKIQRIVKSALLIAVISVIGSVLMSLLVYFRSEAKVRDYSRSVVVVDDAGNQQLGEVKEINEFELEKMRASTVLRIGVDYMYSFSASNIDSRLELAQSYFGKCRYEILTSYKNQNVREQVIQNNLIVDIAIQKIEVSIVNSELKGLIVFEQSFINGSVIQKRILTASCDFMTVKPSNENATGLVIENWIIKTSENE